MFSITNMAGGRLNWPFMPLKTKNFIQGDMLEVYGVADTYSKEWMADREYELISIAMGCNEYFPRDYWNFYINERLVCSQVYAKRLPQGIVLPTVERIEAADVLRLEYVNIDGKANFVWIDYQLLHDEGDA